MNNNILCDPLPAEKSSYDDEFISALFSNPFNYVKFSDTSVNLINEEIYKPNINFYPYKFYILPGQFRTDKIKLKKPIPVVVEKVENYFSISNYELNISDIGESKEKAIINFIEFITRDYLTYKNTPPNKLTEGAKSLLSIYRKLLEDK